MYILNAMTVDKRFSKNLAKIRKLKGYSQRELANLTGISARVIAQYEIDAPAPPLKNIEILANALDVDADDLLGMKKTNSDFFDQEFNVKSLKRFKRLLFLNKHDRSSVYKMVELMLQKPEYQEKLKQTTG